MSALRLQQQLIKELSTLFDGQLFKSKGAEDYAALVPIKIYAQALPYTDGQSGVTYAPFIAVQVQSGKQDEENEPEDVTITLDIGIFDDDENNQGHVTVSNIIETIRNNLFLNRVHGSYYVKPPFSWQLNSEDCWPCFAGSVETHWNLPVIYPDDPNL